MTDLRFPLAAAAPRIMSTALPESERLAAFLLTTNLSKLESYEKAFADMLALFDYIANRQTTARRRAVGMYRSLKRMKTRQMLAAWHFIAARDGAMTIYHFGQVLDGIKATKTLCQSLHNVIDHKQVRAANRLFHREFPFQKEIRNAISHAAELGMTPQAFRTNAFGSNVLMGTGLADRTYSAGIDKQTFSYEISQATLEKLGNIKQLMYGAFIEAEEFTDELLRNQNAASHTRRD